MSPAAIEYLLSVDANRNHLGDLALLTAFSRKHQILLSHCLALSNGRANQQYRFVQPYVYEKTENQCVKALKKTAALHGLCGVGPRPLCRVEVPGKSSLGGNVALVLALFHFLDDLRHESVDVIGVAGRDDAV